MYQENVMVPMGNWAKSRLRNLSSTDKIRDDSKTSSGFGKTFQIGSLGIWHILLMYCT